VSVNWISQKAKFKVSCYRSLNLLAHAQMEELEIGSRCGGHGVCGGDRVLIREGRNNLSQVTEAERKHLSQEELEQGYRLACQSWPQQDHDHLVVEFQQQT